MVYLYVWLLKLFGFICYFDMTIFEIITKHDSILFSIYIVQRCHN